MGKNMMTAMGCSPRENCERENVGKFVIFIHQGISSMPFQFTTLPITLPALTIISSNGVANFTVGNAAGETHVVEMSTNLVL